MLHFTNFIANSNGSKHSCARNCGPEVVRHHTREGEARVDPGAWIAMDAINGTGSVYDHDTFAAQFDPDMGNDAPKPNKHGKTS